MPRKIILEGPKQAAPTHTIDEDGKNHYGIRYFQRYRLDYHVKSVRAEHRKQATGDQLEYLFFNLELYDEHDLGLWVPINVIGPFMRHMMELGSNFEFQRGLIVPRSS